MVAPDRVYQIYSDFVNEPTGVVSLEYVCANPWTFPNLIKDPGFQEEVRQDGRFVEFLNHFEFL
jgi:hypothetical protein